MESSIEKLLKELRAQSDRSNLPTEEEYKQAEREINNKMEQFSIEQRAYFAYSKEAAHKACITY